MKQHVALAAVANVTNSNVYAVRVWIDVHVIIDGFPVDPVIRVIQRSGFSTHPITFILHFQCSFLCGHCSVETDNHWQLIVC